MSELVNHPSNVERSAATGSYPLRSIYSIAILRIKFNMLPPIDSPITNHRSSNPFSHPPLFPRRPDGCPLQGREPGRGRLAAGASETHADPEARQKGFIFSRSRKVRQGYLHITAFFATLAAPALLSSAGLRETFLQPWPMAVFVAPLTLTRTSRKRIRKGFIHKGHEGAQRKAKCKKPGLFRELCVLCV
jgi:hypothetical protein